MGCVCLHINANPTRLHTTFMISKCHFANLERPHSPKGIQPRKPQPISMRALQFCAYCGELSSTLLQITSTVLTPGSWVGRRPPAPFPTGPPGVW